MEATDIDSFITPNAKTTFELEDKIFLSSSNSNNRSDIDLIIDEIESNTSLPLKKPRNKELSDLAFDYLGLNGDNVNEDNDEIEEKDLDDEIKILEKQKFEEEKKVKEQKPTKNIKALVLMKKSFKKNKKKCVFKAIPQPTPNKNDQAINSIEIIAIHFGRTLFGEPGKRLISLLISISAFGSVGAMGLSNYCQFTRTESEFIPKLSSKLYKWSKKVDTPSNALAAQFIY
ncbi:3898_t:CDS:2, partial [Gigaspora rosea]